jgi:hypothetical protein
MLYGPNGQVLVPNKPGMRRGSQVNVFELPPGTVISKRLSAKLHDMIRDNAVLRENIEKADRITGTETLHLAVMRGGKGITPAVQKAMVNNQAAGEIIMRERVQKEGDSLNKSGEGYEKAAA